MIETCSLTWDYCFWCDNPSNLDLFIHILEACGFSYLSYLSDRHSGLSFEMGSSFISRSSSCIIIDHYLCWKYSIYISKLSFTGISHHLGVSERRCWCWLFNVIHSWRLVAVLLFYTGIVLHDWIRTQINQLPTQYLFLYEISRMMIIDLRLKIFTFVNFNLIKRLPLEIFGSIV